jgi:hypothetical protein
MKKNSHRRETFPGLVEWFKPGEFERVESVLANHCCPN